MSKKHKNNKKSNRREKARLVQAHAEQAQLWNSYEQAVALALRDERTEALRVLSVLDEEKSAGSKLKALLCNDQAALKAVEGDSASALQGFEAALAIDQNCLVARENFDLLQADTRPGPENKSNKSADGLDIPCSQPLMDETQKAHLPHPFSPESRAEAPIKVAILSFLFNWPSTGGGIIHTMELARFLGQAGYLVKHFYARYPAWGVGMVAEPLPFDAEALDFEERDWNITAIQARFRQAVERFDPDQVIITDSWNMKPILAEAVEEYPFLLRFQAMECLCPLNNVRLLFESDGSFHQCPKHQLATPGECTTCLHQRGNMSGSLHQQERALSGVGSPEYHARLLRVLKRAQAVLVVNPLTEIMVSPYASKVCVVTAGMDPERFPWCQESNVLPAKPIKTILFAGLLDEWMKGFFVLRDACSRLWERRKDFQVVVTGEKDGEREDFIRTVGWLSQDELAKHLGQADMLVVPTIAQEALGRTAVEAMAAGCPVVASRIGGLPATVQEGVTGLLFEPGDAADLARRIETLLDNDSLRKEMGRAGRMRFEAHYSWDVIIARHYKPLLQRRSRPSGGNGFVPVFSENVDMEWLLESASQFFRVRRESIATMVEAYRRLHETRRYSQTQGERKTLCFEEALLLYILSATHRPRTIVGIGTDIGYSMRRLLDIKNVLGLNSRVVVFCTTGEKQAFSSVEAEVKEMNLDGRFSKEVLETFEPGLIFNDAHGHGLLQEVVRGTLADGRWMLALHDCGRGLCNPHMKIAKEDPAVTSSTGVWERHILAENCGVTNPLGEELDSVGTSTHRLQIFNTPHGLGILVPNNSHEYVGR